MEPAASRISAENTEQIFTDIYGNTEQTVSRIGLIRDATFTCQIKDDSIFYGTGGNPKQKVSRYQDVLKVILPDYTVVWGVYNPRSDLFPVRIINITLILHNKT